MNRLALETAFSMRSSRGWAGRALLALLIAGLGVLLVRHTAAFVIADRSVDQGYRLNPSDARIVAAWSARQTETTTTLAPRQKKAAVLAARQALLRDPTSVLAVATLGLAAQIDGNIARARQFMRYGQYLSRRDLRTALWAIEYAVQRNDVAGALHQYDIVLRTSQKAGDLLFPVLSSAISDANVRAELVKVLKNEPIWSEFFLNYAADNGPDADAVVDLLIQLANARAPIPEYARSSLVSRLVREKAFDKAWRYYATWHAFADRRRSRYARFELITDMPTPFDWALETGGSSIASIQTTENGNFLEYAAPPSGGANVATQLQMLPPGKYRISGRSRGANQPVKSRPYWSVRCIGGDEIGRIVLPQSTDTIKPFSGGFAVPNSCPVQSLALVVQPTDDIFGSTGDVEEVAVTPVE